MRVARNTNSANIRVDQKTNSASMRRNFPHSGFSLPTQTVRHTLNHWSANMHKATVQHGTTNTHNAAHSNIDLPICTMQQMLIWSIDLPQCTMQHTQPMICQHAQWSTSHHWSAKMNHIANATICLPTCTIQHTPQFLVIHTATHSTIYSMDLPKRTMQHTEPVIC